MASIDIRELSHSNTLPEAVFKRTAPGTPTRHQRAVDIIANQGKIGEHELAEQYTVKTEEVPSLAGLRVAIEQKISGDKSTGVVIRNAEQTRRLNQANSAAELVHAVLDRGYHNLTRGQKLQVQERVLPALLRRWPELNTAFGPMNRRQRLDALEDILNDPEFHRELLTALNEVQAEDTGSVAKSDFETKKENYERRNQDLVSLQRDYTEAQANKQEFDPGGAKNAILTGLPSSAQLEADLEAKKREVKHLEGQLRTKTAQFTPISNFLGFTGTDPDKQLKAARAQTLFNDIDALNAQIETKNQEQKDIEARKKRREDLEEEKDKAKEKERTKHNELDTLQREVNKLQEDMLTAQADVGISKLDKAAKEQKFVTDLQSIFARAAETVMEKRATRADEARNELLAKLPKDAVTTGRNHRWMDEEGKLRKDRIKSDYHRMITGHIDDVAKDMLVDQGNMQRAEVEHKLTTDEAFAKDARDQAATELTQRYIQGGGKFKPDEIRRLEASDLGTAIITNAIVENKTLNEQIDAILPKPKEKDKVKVDRGKQIREILGKMPKFTRRQLLIASLMVAGGYFAGPAILSYLLPEVHKAAVKWGVVAAKHKSIGTIGKAVADLPHYAAEGVKGVGHAVDTVLTAPLDKAA